MVMSIYSFFELIDRCAFFIRYVQLPVPVFSVHTIIESPTLMILYTIWRKPAAEKPAAAGVRRPI